MEALRRYANRGEGPSALGRTLKKLNRAAGKRPPDVARDRPCRVQRVRERLEPTAIAQLVADYEAGTNTTELTTRYGIGKGSVIRLLEEQGAKMRRQPMTREESAVAIRQYQQGSSLAEVGRRFNRDPAVIRNLLIRAGIPRRDSQGRDR